MGIERAPNKEHGGDGEGQQAKIRPVIYIGGPFNAKSAWHIRENVYRAEALSLLIWRAGAVGYSPHVQTGHFYGAAQEEVFLEGHMEMLRRCDALVLMYGWQYSTGNIAEKEEAERLGLPVYGPLGSTEDFQVNAMVEEVRSLLGKSVDTRAIIDV